MVMLTPCGGLLFFIFTFSTWSTDDLFESKRTNWKLIRREFFFQIEKQNPNSEENEEETIQQREQSMVFHGADKEPFK